MKKFFLISSMLTCAFAYSQMQVQKLDGTPIHDGDVFTYGVFDDPELGTENSSLKFTVANTSSSPIKVSVLCEKLNNTDGMDFEFCFGGNCMPFVIEGQDYPMSGQGYPIAAHGNSGTSDHFKNMTGYDDPMSMVFKFYQMDDLGNPIGTPVHVTYKYDKNLAVSDVNTTKDVVLKNTIVTNTLELVSKNKTSFQLYDMNSKLVMNSELKAGDNTINVSNLAAGVYILNAKNANGKMQSQKIIKK
ncbi:T9SS type A sorting domain-containing protein [Soonwooa sp.]|uniref:T9SS type A sorting domain-containing protein n=1 Tax=Soonwooa sp. TaxID=1938592 RepID=UPI0026079364|nr:T9SS type A sorting domain-containing protein [Soonwooa sp.]